MPNKVCAGCAAPLQRDAAFCPSCGKPVPGVEPTTSRPAKAVGHWRSRSTPVGPCLPLLANCSPGSAPAAQLTLIGAGPETVETDGDRAVAGAMDTITTRFGRDAVRPARLTRRRSNPQESGGPEYIGSASSYPDGYANHSAHAESTERADC